MQHSEVIKEIAHPHPSSSSQAIAKRCRFAMPNTSSTGSGQIRGGLHEPYERQKQQFNKNRRSTKQTMEMRRRTKLPGVERGHRVAGRCCGASPSWFIQHADELRFSESKMETLYREVSIRVRSMSSVSAIHGRAGEMAPRASRQEQANTARVASANM